MKVLVALGALCIISCLLRPASSQQLPDGKNVGKLFGGYATRTRLSTLTSTVLYTCALTVAKGVVCTGRKKRGVRVLETIDDIQSREERSLDSTLLDDPVQVSVSDPKGKDEVGKLFIALTTFTTITTTSLSINKSTTVSLSFNCLPLGGTVADVCG